MGFGSVMAIEAGKYAPTLERALQISQTLGKPLEQVFHWDK
jgi:DNA-binding XRE family transcriptional regulator